MKLKNFLIILFLLFILVYVTNITAIPKSVVLFEGESLSLGTILGIVQNKESIITTSLNNEEGNIINEEKIKLSLFNIVDLKDVNVTTIKNTKVVPLRKYCGIKTICKWNFSNRYDRNRRTKTV